MAAGDPTGDDLCVGTTNGNALPEFGVDLGVETEITFGAPIELTEGVKYAIVQRAPDADGLGDCAFCQTQLIGGYPNGSKYHSDDESSTWTETAGQDFWFKTLEGDGGLVDSNTFVAENVVSSFYGSKWLAQTFTAFATYTIAKVKLKLYREVGATPGTITVSIRATSVAPGAPTLVSPTPTGVTNITLDETPLEWAAGDPAGDTYEIYFRKSGDAWTLVGAAQAGVEWAISFGTLDYGTTYEWRVDATNEIDTTTGDTWSFTTISFNRILISYVLITGGSGAGPYDDPPGVEGTDWRWTGENNMLAVRRLIAAANSKIWYESI